MSNNLREPYLTIISTASIFVGLVIFITITGNWGVLRGPKLRLSTEYPEYYSLVVKGDPSFHEIKIVGESNPQTNNRKTTEAYLDGVKKWYTAVTSDKITDAYLYFEGSVNNGQPLNFTKDGLYFKISGSKELGGYLISASGTLPTPVSDTSTRLIFDLSNISYYTDHSKSTVMRDQNFIQSMNWYTQGYEMSVASFIASQNPPTVIRRLSIFYRYADGTSDKAMLGEVSR